MNVNKLTPGYNVMWESPRMMLPQHKDSIVERDKDAQMRQRPELTEEAQEELFGCLLVSLKRCLTVTITLFDGYEDRIITGIVGGLDPRLKLVKMALTGRSLNLRMFYE
ncbi:hypothetical protein GCM10023310_08150 [Paenibacillus vulneris]